jgi:PASTA domain
MGLPKEEDMAALPPARLSRFGVCVGCVLLSTAGLTVAAAAEQQRGRSSAPRATLVVPDVRGQAYVFAKVILEDAGFAWRVHGAVGGFSANLVASQMPAPGARVLDTGAPTIALRLDRNAKYRETGIPENFSPYRGTRVLRAGARLQREAARPRAHRPAKKPAKRPVRSHEPVKKAPPTRAPEPVQKAPRPVRPPEPEQKAPRPVRPPEPVQKAPRPVRSSEPVEKAPPPVRSHEPVKKAPPPVRSREPAKKTPRPVRSREPVSEPRASRPVPSVKQKPARIRRPPAFHAPGAPREPRDEMPLPKRAWLLGLWLEKHPLPTHANVDHWLYQHAWVVTGAKFGWWRGARALRILIGVDGRVIAAWGMGALSREVALAALAEVRAKKS